MKSNNTHTVQQIEKFLFELPNMIVSARTKEEKKALLAERKKWEKFMNDINIKEINGKKYPVRKQPKDISKSELLKLIDSVETKEYNKSDALIQAQLMRNNGF